MAPVSALSLIVLVYFMGGADTTEVECFWLLFEIRFILCLLTSIFVVLPRFQEELLLNGLQRSLLPPIRLLRVDFLLKLPLVFYAQPLWIFYPIFISCFIVEIFNIQITL